MIDTVFKLVDRAAWRAAVPSGVFHGSPADARDGFIHLSTAHQVPETAARHFAGQSGLALVAVAVASLGDALRWEPSRGGALFPHLYGPLPFRAVRWVADVGLDASGRHVFPDFDRPDETVIT